MSAQTRTERISQIDSKRAAVGERRQLKGDVSMAPEFAARYVGRHAGAALAAQDLMESAKGALCVKLSGTTADNVIRLKI